MLFFFLFSSKFSIYEITSALKLPGAPASEVTRDVSWGCFDLVYFPAVNEILIIAIKDQIIQKMLVSALACAFNKHAPREDLRLNGFKLEHKKEFILIRQTWPALNVFLDPDYVDR